MMPRYSYPASLVKWNLFCLALSTNPSGSNHRFNELEDCGQYHGDNLDSVTVLTDSFKMAGAFVGEQTAGAVAQASAQTIDISVWWRRLFHSSFVQP